ncbi:MAG: hypothetical protein V7459_05895 [Oceanicoccus sp.]
MTNVPFSKYASVKASLVLLLLVAIFNAIIMPNLAGDQQAVPIDLQFAYSPERAYELVNSYSEKTRYHYMIGEMTVDVLYPIVYTLFLSLTLLLLFPKNPKIALIAYVIFFADMLENVGIITMLYNFPKELYTVAMLTSVFSTIKWSVVAITLSLLIVGLVKVLITKFVK